MTSNTTNNLGIHPAPGYVMAEVFASDKAGMIHLPNKRERSEALETVIVLEDARVLPPPADDLPPGFRRMAPGTRLICSGGNGIAGLVPHRKIIFVEGQNVIAGIPAGSALNPAPLEVPFRLES